MWSPANALGIMRHEKRMGGFFFFRSIIRAQGPLGQRTGSWRSTREFKTDVGAVLSIPDRRIIRIIRSPDDAPCRTYVRISARSAAVPFSRSTGRRHARSSVSLSLSFFPSLPISILLPRRSPRYFHLWPSGSTFLTREYVRGFFYREYAPWGDWARSRLILPNWKL